MPLDFVHLHCHSDRSFLDGVGKPHEYAELAASLGQRALAITDHGQLYGLPAIRQACLAVGIKPIYGCEFYANDKRDETKEEKKRVKKDDAIAEGGDPTFTDAHLVVLARNATGWRNLLRLNHDAVRDGYYYKPRTTHELVCRHNDGLIATTACLGSLFGQYARADKLQELRGLLRQFLDAFGPERFFYEVHFNESPDQHKVNEVLRTECRKLGIEPILAQDVHYACGHDVARQDEMVSSLRRQPLSDPKLFRLSARRLDFATPEQMVARARKWGFAIDKDFIRRAAHNTVRIAESIDADIYGDGSLKPPRYLLHDGRPVADSFATLKTFASRGLKQRLAENPSLDREVYKARLIRELGVIRRCGMSDFFLVTMDIVQECRRRGVFVWTRGSGCASLVASCIGITTFDPVRFGLLFERFVDTERANAPDFDLDIDSHRRAEIVAWLREKYGGSNGENIARIIAVTTFGLKSAIRDVCFAHDVDKAIAFGISDASDKLNVSVERRLETVSIADRSRVFDETRDALAEAAPKFRDWIRDNADLVDAALTMVGRARGRTLHAAGYIVTPTPLVEHVPIDRTKDSEGNPVYTTAWGEGQAVQDLGGTGLMKIDLLALDTVGVVSAAIRLASQRHGRDVAKELDGWAMDFESKQVCQEYASGNGFGLHQLNTSDQQLAALCGRLKPKSVRDIIAAVALYRPGSLAFIDDFVARAHGRVQRGELHPVLEEILAETHGIIVYQEQIMAILHRVADIPLRKAYEIIKAIGKKKLDKIVEGRKWFLEGAQSHSGIPEREAETIFNVIEKFAEYGFNKAHAASYGILSWMTAYLRANYPLEFWWAWLNFTPNESPHRGSRVKERKIELLMRAAKRCGVDVGRPRVGLSSSRWSVTKTGKLLAPLSMIVGVGDHAAEAQRDAARKEPFTDVWAFLSWAEDNGRFFNSKAVKAVALAGALRFPDADPVYTTEQINDIVNLWAEEKKSKASSRADRIRDAVGLNPKLLSTLPNPDTRAAMERAAFGFTFWNDPWSQRGRAEKVFKLANEGRIADYNERHLRGRRRAYRLLSVSPIRDKKGKEMAFLSLQSLPGDTVKAVCFSSVWTRVKGKLRADCCYLVAGDFDRSGALIIDARESPFKNLDAVEVRA